MQEWIAVAALIVAAASFAVNLFKNKASGVWDLSDRLNKLERDREKQRQLIYNQIEIKFDEAIDKFGETMRSHAEHVRQLELDLYKNFVRLPAFEATIRVITDTINARFDKLEERLDRVDRKF